MKIEKKQTETPIEEHLQGEEEGELALSEKNAEKAWIMEWLEFLRHSSDSEIVARFAKDAKALLDKYSGDLGEYCCLFLFDRHGSIGTFESDRIFRAISEHNPSGDKDVLLLIHSNGGRIEPAYQISKICKRFSKEKFVVAIPREAKSAATLIAIGADEIHMGILGELGPIDPQLGGLPALGIVQALATIASMAEQYPGSSDMLARYLAKALTVEQIGYCERVSESAVQYAERLLSTKESIGDASARIANLLVYEYKDHGFVIDVDEARELLGDDAVKDESQELNFAEEFFRLYEGIDLLVEAFKDRGLSVVGDCVSDVRICEVADS